MNSSPAPSDRHAHVAATKPELGECPLTASHTRRACDNGGSCWCIEHPDEVAAINANPEVIEARSAACVCGWPEKDCLRRVLGNGPPFPPQPCEPKIEAASPALHRAREQFDAAVGPDAGLGGYPSAATTLAVGRRVLVTRGFSRGERGVITNSPNRVFTGWTVKLDNGRIFGAGSWELEVVPHV